VVLVVVQVVEVAPVAAGKKDFIWKRK